MQPSLKLFYTRQNADKVQACVTVDDYFYTKDLTPDEAIQLAAEILDHALVAKRHGARTLPE